MLADEVKAPGPALEELLSNLPETMDGVRANPFLPAGSDALRRLSAMFDGQDTGDIRRWPAEHRQEVHELIDSLREELTRRIDDSARPQDALARCIADLRAHAARLTEVSVLLQTGQGQVRHGDRRRIHRLRPIGPGPRALSASESRARTDDRGPHAGASEPRLGVRRKGLGPDRRPSRIRGRSPHRKAHASPHECAGYGPGEAAT